MVAPGAFEGLLGTLDPSGSDRAHRAHDVMHGLHSLAAPFGCFPSHDMVFPGKGSVHGFERLPEPARRGVTDLVFAFDSVEQVAFNLVQPSP